ncbi:neurexin-2-like isoform X11 [Biomphalaria glabrata]|uniref:Neurexin-2-like isoform X11 n=1 Tax=Biomphalaria glabrata TaxID=6526 RepID=A0A9W2ZTF9_BIOGL|nr:neurexin-2-like isoform X11 [Biomphalaria glabrata]
MTFKDEFYTQDLLLVALCACLLPVVVTLNLDGSPGSYVKYPPWEPCLNGSFSFEFKTREQNALLLYLNKGEYLFFEIKVYKGGVRLRVNVGEGTLILRAGENLDNNEWHSVEVRQDGEMTYLSVDGREQQKKSPGLLQYYGHVTSNDTFLVIGGLPIEYESKKFKSLALPSVIFEPRFRGSIRNLFYRTCGGESIRPQPIESSGLLTNEVDLCERGNPCLNGGKCLTTDNGVLCNCASTEYKGDRCELQKVPSDATFLGTQYFSYNLSSKGDGLVSNQDMIMLDFRTKQPSSLLFYTGNAKDYITAGLIDGGVFLTVNLGSGQFEVNIRPADARFDDNRWHQLVIRRDAKELTRDKGVCYISVELDGMYRETGSTSGIYVRLSSNVLYVAGSPHTSTLAGSRVKTNFKGCLRKVRYQADSIRIDLTELARKEHGLLDVVGEVIFDKCQELVESQPVTFATPDAYLTVPTWDRSSMRGSLAFQFRTVEPGGLLMYSNGDRDSKDFFALELLDSHLYLIWDMGSGIQKIQASKVAVSDGNPHDIYFEFYENKGYISVDGIKELFESKKYSDRFDLHGHLYVGGLDPEINVSSLPRELWAVMLGLNYIGCLQDLVVNGNQVDLMAAAKLQNKTSVMGYCRKMPAQCTSHPCNHQGKCIEGWNRFTCDCRATGYTGSVCQTADLTLRFDGTQYLKVTLATESITQAEDISLRFRSMHPSGLLFFTTGKNEDGMELYLDSGTLVLSIRVEGGVKTLTAGHTLNDDRWHTVFIKRRVHTVELTIDQERPVTDKIPGSTFSLATSRIYVGHVTPAVPNADLPSQAKDIALRSVEAGHMVQNDEGTSGRHSGFIGSMQSFIFNGNHLFQMAQSGSKDSIEISARFSSDEQVVREPVTFKSEDAFAILPRLQVHEKFSISFQFKTTESDGLIFYNDGTGQDFFAMELSQGYMYYVYNMGEGPEKIKANVNQPLNDNKWHEVRLLRTETTKQLLRVDDNTPTIDDLTGAKNNKFDLSGPLHVGGLHKVKFPSLPKLISSQHGFVGCLGSLDLNGYLPNLLQQASYIHEGVGDGCRGPMTKCVNDSCANQGRCVQQWTSYRCDCDMTSYTGPMCKEESVSYKFGPGPGLMTFTHPEGQQPSTNFETLAFGFQTFQDNAILLRVDSQNFVGDYIQLELDKGYVFLIYNMGTIDHPLGNFYQKVNDGRYHVVRFTRHGPNATLQIDLEMPQVKNPTGQQSHTFNNQAYIRIGGKKESNGSITRHFEGIISGLVLNGVHIFELAKQHDPKVKLEGNIALNIQAQPSKVLDSEDEMQSTQGHTTAKEGVTDDIISTGPGSGCQFDDEDDCSGISSGNEEEIITAVVIIKTTTSPPTTTTKKAPPCEGPHCESSTKHVDLKTPSTPNIDIISDPEHDNMQDQMTSEPGSAADGDKDDDTGINLGLILGITGSVLVAVIVLCIALCKLRSRDEGTYKVDETQNFSALLSKKNQGNGAVASGSDSGTGKRGKKKDVKEWYV